MPFLAECSVNVRLVRRVRKITKSDSFVVSIHPYGITRLQLYGFSWNFIFEIFRKSAENVQVSLKSDENKGYFT